MTRLISSLFAMSGVLTLVAVTMAATPMQQQLIEGAKKEGQVTIWVNTWEEGKVLEPFKQKYPFLKVTVWDGRSTEILARVTEEARAGKFSPDLLSLNDTELAVLRDAGLLREYDWPAHVNSWQNQPKHSFWRNHSVSPRVPTYNTRMISANEAPKSWEDLKNPRWQGKTVVSTSGSDVMLLFANMWKEKQGELNWEKTFAFWGEVIKNTKPHVGGSFTTANQLHIAGEFPLFPVNSFNYALVLKKQGAPVGFVRVGRSPVSSWGFAVPKTVPHPNAAKLFLDYLVSPEALIRYSDANQVPVMDPEAAKKAEVNLVAQELGLEWVAVPEESWKPADARKAVDWWNGQLGLKRGGRQ
jgi:iron(III) transport system substrate-binding protein